jgi:hypothetical protein
MGNSEKGASNIYITYNNCLYHSLIMEDKVVSETKFCTIPQLATRGFLVAVQASRIK